MNNDTFQKILTDVENTSHLQSKDIPALDLYMDQIMTLFDVNLADNKRHEDDKLLTKTMIKMCIRDSFFIFIAMKINIRNKCQTKNQNCYNPYLLFHGDHLNKHYML